MPASNDPPSTLGGLLQRHKNGDVNAINEILECCRERFERLARVLLNRPGAARDLDTDDVVNEAVTRLIPVLRAKPFDSSAKFLGYAAQVMRNHLKDLASKRRPQHFPAPGSDAAGPHPGADAPETTDDPAKLAEWTSIHSTIDKLPEEQRQLFDLLFYHGLAVAEASDQLDVSETTLRTHWNSAKLHFMRLYGNATPPF
ncbi:RNA polymerase sigma factor [Gemmata sp. JC717]|uniref:RNA polymerase sigma factor n=1 Tax=Gemmata algarum TaxID=2975278 RepID=UPI0021BB0935|nr:RNA polymerase sigma factor [Gemmata algarum]MDY3557029.1 RNA polymerase sigma factor [Gemmata algarum]